MADEQSSEVVIREAVKEDCGQISSLIQELADYEKMSDEVLISAARLAADGFPEDAPAAYTCHVAVRGSELVGMALHYFTYSTWTGRMVYLEDLYVKPEWRGHGLGRRLFSAVAAWVESAHCSRLNFSVLGWNSRAKDFYGRLGAVNLTETEQWELYRVTGDALHRLAARHEH